MTPAQRAFWMVLGYGILLVACVMHAWEPAVSTINPAGRQPRPISLWKWKWLNPIYGNREDGVSGKEALIWTQGESQYGLADRTLVRVYYRPNSWDWSRAWLWSAWRNNVNEGSR